MVLLLIILASSGDLSALITIDWKCPRSVLLFIIMIQILTQALHHHHHHHHHRHHHHRGRGACSPASGVPGGGRV
jgi:hypothetical protein